MSRHWDFHDFNDPDDDPVTRLRHLGGDYGPYDPANWDIDEGEDFEDDSDELEWDSDDSFLQTLCKDFEHGTIAFSLPSHLHLRTLFVVYILTTH